MYRIIILLLCTVSMVSAQNKIDWDGKYQLQLADFQNPATQIGQTDIISIHPGASINFYYQMSNAVFMFTKNFNSKVDCTFQCETAALVAPDSMTAMYLLHFARFQFDLSELYARKLRKALYEEKGAFSDAGFAKPLYDSIQAELSNRLTAAQKETELGKNSEKLKMLHKEALSELEGLQDFCKDCKTRKRRKNPKH